MSTSLTSYTTLKARLGQSSLHTQLTQDQIKAHHPPPSSKHGNFMPETINDDRYLVDPEFDTDYEMELIEAHKYGYENKTY